MTRAGSSLPSEVRRGFPILVAGRLVSNVGFRFVYPFLPAISRGLGVSIGTVGIALSIRELSGLAAPVLGRIADTGRRRAGMVVGLAASGISLVLTAASPGIVAFTVGLVAFSVAKVGYDTAMGAWIGDHVPFARRGRFIGISELSWAMALLIGVPIVGWLIEVGGWRTPFVVVGVATIVVAVAVAFLVAADPPRGDGARPRLRLLPGAIGVYLMLAAMSFSMQLIFVVHGFWLEDELGLTVTTIGLASIVLGVGELVGSGATVTLTDRLGKRRSVLIGCAALVAPLALLGSTGGRLVVALGLLALGVLAFEFAFVSALPLVSELDPDARGAAVGTALAIVTVARAVGTVTATTLYAASGMGTVGGVAATGVAVTFVVTLVAVREPAPAGAG